MISLVTRQKHYHAAYQTNGVSLETYLLTFRSTTWLYSQRPLMNISIKLS